MTEEQHKLIKDNKTIIEAFQRTIDLYFDTLCSELNLTEDGINWLFDYIYNSNVMSNGEESFEEYLKNYGKTPDEFFESDSGDDIECKEE